MQPQNENSTVIVVVGLPPASLPSFEVLGSWVLEAKSLDASGGALRNIAGGVALVVFANPTLAQLDSARAAFPEAAILSMVNAVEAGDEEEAAVLALVRAGSDFVLPVDASRSLIQAACVSAKRIWDARREASLNPPAKAEITMRVDMTDAEARMASAAHEINNPLQYIIAGIEELESMSRSRPELIPIAHDMRHGAERIRRVTRSMLPSARSSVVPLVPAITPVPRISPSIAPVPAQRRILVIDDEEALVRTYKRCLRNHEVVAAIGGRAALEILSTDQRFDVILCDLMMPNVDGPMVHSHIAEHYPQLLERVVFCSGGAFTPRVRSFLERVTNVVLDKPVTTAQLHMAIDKLLRRLSSSD